jgi:hypothetical protein
VPILFLLAKYRFLQYAFLACYNNNNNNLYNGVFAVSGFNSGFNLNAK